MATLLDLFRKNNFHIAIKMKPNCRYLVLLVNVFLVISLLISGCSNSLVTGTTQPTSSTQIPNLTASQSPTDSPTPQKPGILSRKTFTVAGSSMEPTIKKGDRVTGYPVYRDLQRGDIAEFTSPDSNKYSMISRIIGLPGETIEIKDGQVIINGAVLNEPYIAEPPAYSISLTVIPEKNYFTFGDSRNKSLGSQDFGPVPLANIHYIIEK